MWELHNGWVAGSLNELFGAKSFFVKAPIWSAKRHMLSREDGRHTEGEGQRVEINTH